MYKSVIGFVFALLVVWPGSVRASGLSIDVKLAPLQDVASCAEVWYNNKVIWRLVVLADGAKPAYEDHDGGTVFIVPDIINGCFKIKIQ